MEDSTPEAIVDSTLTTLVRCTRRRDLPATLELFAEDAAIYGSDEGEFARGRDDVRAFLESIYAEPVTYGSGARRALRHRRRVMLAPRPRPQHDSFRPA